MPTFDQMLLPAPLGMAPSTSTGSLPIDKCRLLSGMMPARLGVQKPAPQPKLLTTIVPRNAGEQIQGYAVYKPKLEFFVGPPNLAGDLLVFTDRNLYILPIWSDNVDPTALGWFNDYIYLSYDEIARGQRCHLQYATGAAGLQYANSATPAGTFDSGDWNHDLAVGTMHSIAYVQFDNELLFCAPSTVGLFPGSANNLWRYYRTATNKQFIFAMYIPSGGAPTLGTIIAGVLNGTYEYAWTWVDELGRESSPSDTLTSPVAVANSWTITRGTEASGTSRAVQETGAGWRLYRFNPGAKTFNLVSALGGTDPLPYGTTTFYDNYSDALVNAQPIMPSFGENDPPDAATYLTLHKNRVVLNDAVDFGVVQISNANSATQFSSITLPTDAAAGLRLSPGDDADNVITGLESIGDMLWMAKSTTYYLLQGDSIANWNVQQIYKNRGCDNPFTVQRTEEYVLFKSNDGMYELSYQAGMVSPKNSWEIDDILNSFSPMLDPDRSPPFDGVFTPAITDGNTDGRPRSTQSVTAYSDFVRSFYWQQYYFLCLPDRTLVFDNLGKGWADTGLGPVRFPVVYSQTVPWNNTGFPVGSLPDTVFLSLGDAYTGNLEIRYFTAADTPFDSDIDTAPTFSGIVETRDLDLNSQQLSKRGAFYSIFGTTGKPMGTVLGYLSFYSGTTQIFPEVPIIANLSSRKYNPLFSQGLPASMVGEQLWVRERWTTTDIQISTRLPELVDIS